MVHHMLSYAPGLEIKLPTPKTKLNFNQFKLNQGCWEEVSVNSLPHKHEALDHQHSHEKPSVVVYTCNLRAGEAESDVSSQLVSTSFNE